MMNSDDSDFNRLAEVISLMFSSDGLVHESIRVSMEVHRFVFAPDTYAELSWHGDGKYLLCEFVDGQLSGGKRLRLPYVVEPRDSVQSN